VIIVHLLVIAQNMVDDLVQFCYPKNEGQNITGQVREKLRLLSGCPLRVKQWRVDFQSPTQTGRYVR
jgi:hypothetical protein